MNYYYYYCEAMLFKCLSNNDPIFFFLIEREIKLLSNKLNKMLFFQ